MFIYALRPMLHSIQYLRLAWTLIDVLCAYFLSDLVHTHINSMRVVNVAPSREALARARRLADVAFGAYFLSPMTLGAWTALSLASVVNALVAGTLLFTIKGGLVCV